MSNKTRIVKVSVTAANSATTTYGTATPGLQTYDAIKGRVTITGVTGGTLNIYVQQSWDAGVTWDDCAAFTQAAAAAAATTYDFSIVLDSTIRTIKSGTLATAVPVLTAGTICAGPWAPLLRLVATTGASTTLGNTTDLYLFAWQSSDA